MSAAYLEANIHPGSLAGGAVDIQARFALRYADFTLDVDLRLPTHGISALFGPSGCGKTTCLRLLAGLQRAPGGYLRVGAEVWQDDAQKIWVPTHRRGIGYVFQEASLFAHLDVRRNLEYGMRRAAGASRAALEQAVELLGIGHLTSRMPAHLSGGERQRVAIARALATAPRLLLMDEPLAALDAQRKAEVLPYLERLHLELDIPMVYVSHAADEVARLSDYLVQLQDGRVAASGLTRDMLTRLDLPLGHGDGAAALVHATVVEYEEAFHLATAEFSGGRLSFTAARGEIGRRLAVRIQARDVTLSFSRVGDSSVLNVFACSVLELAEDGVGEVMVALDCGGVRLLARVTRKSVVQMGLGVGVRVFAQVKGVAVLR